MKIKILLMVMLIGSLGVLNCFAQEKQEQERKNSTVIDSIYVFDVEKMKDEKTSRKTKGFIAKPGKGPLWVVATYRGEPTSLMSGETVFEIIPEAIPVPMGDNIFSFKSREMVSYIDKNPIQINYANVVITEEMIKAKFPDIWETMDMEREKKLGKMKQSIKVGYFHVKTEEESQFLISLLSNKEMKPAMLEVVVGQGEIPAEIKEYIKQQGGTWWERNKIYVGMFGVLFIMIGFMIKSVL